MRLKRNTIAVKLYDNAVSNVVTIGFRTCKPHVFRKDDKNSGRYPGLCVIISTQPSNIISWLWSEIWPIEYSLYIYSCGGSYSISFK